MKKFGTTSLDELKQKDFAVLFEQQAAQSSRNIALIQNDIYLTYGDLHLWKQAVQYKLKQAGIRKGQIVIVYMDNSMEAIVAYLAILAIRAIILPVNASLSQTLLQEIFQESQAKMILYKDSNYTGNYLSLKIEPFISSPSKLYPLQTGSDTDCAVCICTSGSTGKFKYILLTYRGIYNHIMAKIQFLSLNNNMMFCQSFANNFVASLWQIFTPIILGASLVIYPYSSLQDFYGFFTHLENDRISLVSLIPHTLRAYLNIVRSGRKKVDFFSLKTIVLTGEKVDASLVNDFYELYPNIQLINAYGMSETSDDIFHYKIPSKTNHSNIPIGIPIENTCATVLDENYLPTIEGELFVAGDCIAKEYLNGLFSDRFITLNGYGKTKFFRTGDWVKKLENENYLFLGRRDYEVKIRGHRVNLESVESVIYSHPFIIHCVVFQTDFDCISKLTVVYQSSPILSPQQLRKYLLEQLPDYMVPSAFFSVSEFKFTQSGKIDRIAMQQAFCQRQENSEVTCQISVEDKVRHIINSHTNGITNIQIDMNNTIISTGIDSLNIVNLLLSLEEEFGIYFDGDKIQLAAFQTVGELVNYIKRKLQML